MKRAALIAAAITLLVASVASAARIAGRDGSTGMLPMGRFVSLETAGPLAVARDGALYVTDVAAHRVLVRLPDGRFRVIAGTGRSGFSGDGGPATRAELSVITDIAVSPAGSLYIADDGRVRMVSGDGVIRTVAGDGRPLPTARDGEPLARIVGGKPALAAALGSRRSAEDETPSIAFSRSGQLYMSTGVQILRLTNRATLTPVRAAITTGPRFLRGNLRGFGPLAIDAHGHIDVSGVNGWSIWQVARDGVVREIGPGSVARRSGGNYSLLETAGDGSVYAENGDELLRIEGRTLRRTYTFSASINGEYFELTYFAFGPHGAIYADEIPGGEAWEARQQLVSVNHHRETLLWEQGHQGRRARAWEPARPDLPHGLSILRPTWSTAPRWRRGCLSGRRARRLAGSGVQGVAPVVRTAMWLENVLGSWHSRRPRGTAVAMPTLASAVKQSAKRWADRIGPLQRWRVATPAEHQVLRVCDAGRQLRAVLRHDEPTASTVHKLVVAPAARHRDLLARAAVCSGVPGRAEVLSSARARTRAGAWRMTSSAT